MPFEHIWTCYICMFILGKLEKGYGQFHLCPFWFVNATMWIYFWLLIASRLSYYKKLISFTVLCVCLVTICCGVTMKTDQEAVPDPFTGTRRSIYLPSTTQKHRNSWTENTLLHLEVELNGSFLMASQGTSRCSLVKRALWFGVGAQKVVLLAYNATWRRFPHRQNGPLRGSLPLLRRYEPARVEPN